MDGLDHLGTPGAQGGMGRIGAHQGVVLPAALALVSIGLAHQYPHTGDGGVAPLGIQSRVVRHLHVGDDEQVGPLVLELLLKGGQVVRLVLGPLLPIFFSFRAASRAAFTPSRSWIRAVQETNAPMS